MITLLKKHFSWLSLGYLISSLLLFFYSFTQVDLGLTLIRHPFWRQIENYFQYVGYFNRPLSTFLYLFIVILLFSLYFATLYLVSKQKISKAKIWSIILMISVILTFSYNAFSYDLFNYIFDAKIITFYHQNPYLHKALDFQGDPMLGFMHWTHVTYPYGPVWLVITVCLSFLGFNFFLPTFFLFKILTTICFLGTVYYIAKIIRKLALDNETLGMVLFGLNPLVIIESLVSSHNDIVMFFLSMLALSLFLDKKYLRSFLILIVSIGIKYATAFLLPVFLISYLLLKKKQQFSWSAAITWMIGLMTVAMVLASMRTNYQPWYLLYVLPFAALLSNNYSVIISSIIVTLAGLLEYVPFLYLGTWNLLTSSILFYLHLTAVVLIVIAVLFCQFVLRQKKMLQ